MRTIIWFINFWLILIKLTPSMLKAKCLESKGELMARDQLISNKVKYWSSAMLKGAGVTLDIVGKENIPSESVVFVSNHQGNFDIPLLLFTLGAKGFIAKKELTSLPLIRTWMRFLNCIFIDRKDPKQSLRSINQSTQIFEKGNSLIIFPEGTRSKSSTLGDFKLGALKMAFANNVPIVPIAIDGSYKIMEQQGFWIKPAKIKVIILPKIETVGMAKQDAKKIGSLIKELISNELNKPCQNFI